MNKKNFNCEKCGQCCLYNVIITKAEKKIIEHEGYKKFTEEKNNIITIKLKNNQCYFLDKNNHCKIYENRPKICKDYPFFTNKKISTCKPSLAQRISKSVISSQKIIK